MTRTVNLYRFRNVAGLAVSHDGQTYLDAAAVRTLAARLAALADDLETRDFQESTFDGFELRGVAI